MKGLFLISKTRNTGKTSQDNPRVTIRVFIINPIMLSIDSWAIWVFRFLAMVANIEGIRNKLASKNMLKNSSMQGIGIAGLVFLLAISKE